MSTAVSGRARLPGRQVVVVLLGIAAAAAALLVVHQSQGVYWTDTSVYFLAPSDTTHNNSYTYTTDSVIATAGLVGQLVQPPGSGAGNSTQATLVAQGARDGHRIVLPNSGGQWDLNFDKPVLDVQVVGSDPDEVHQETVRLVDDIHSTLDELQQGVAPRSRITLTQAPADVQVRYGEGDPRRAMAVTLLVAGILTGLAVRWSSRRRGTEQRHDHALATPQDTDPTPDRRRTAPVGAID